MAVCYTGNFNEKFINIEKNREKFFAERLRREAGRGKLLI